MVGVQALIRVEGVRTGVVRVEGVPVARGGVCLVAVAIPHIRPVVVAVSIPPSARIGVAPASDGHQVGRTQVPTAHTAPTASTGRHTRTRQEMSTGHTYRHTDIQTELKTHIQTYRHSTRHTCRNTATLTPRHTDTQTQRGPDTRSRVANGMRRLGRERDGHGDGRSKRNGRRSRLGPPTPVHSIRPIQIQIAHRLATTDRAAPILPFPSHAAPWPDGAG